MKGNNGKAARRRHNQHILSTLGGMFGMLTLLTFLCYVMEIGPWDHYAYYDNAATAGQQQQQQLRRHRRNGGGHGPLEYLGGAGKPQSSREFRKSLSDQFQVGEKSEEEVLRQVLAAELQLITLVFMEEEIIHAPKNSYDGVYGKFCKLDWTHRKRDPSAGTFYHYCMVRMSLHSFLFILLTQTFLYCCVLYLNALCYSSNVS